MKKLIELFVSFAKIGSLTFGGGYAMLPMLQRELADNKGWTTEEELLDYYAIGQCTPGVIAVNVATFVGQKQAGIIGGIAASLGMIFPSLVIINIIAALLSGFADYQIVKSAFAGIRVCVVVLIANAVYKIIKKSVKDIPAAVIMLCVVAASALLKLSPVLIVLVAAVAGVTIKNIQEAKK